MVNGVAAAVTVGKEPGGCLGQRVGRRPLGDGGGEPARLDVVTVPAVLAVEFLSHELVGLRPHVAPRHLHQHPVGVVVAALHRAVPLGRRHARCRGSP